MKRPSMARGVGLVAVSGLAAALAACSSGGDGAAGAGTSPVASRPAGSSAGSASSATGNATAAGQPFGPGCAQLPPAGPGSLQAMSTAPLAAAAATNPLLATFVQAATRANLVDTLNTTPDITVLAPANPAFSAVPPPTLTAVLGDTPRLTQVLTHHAIPGRLGPERLTGEQNTLANDAVRFQGSGADLTVSGDQTLSGQPAKVLCGNIRTANATVYIIDQVLKPQKPG